MPRFGCHLQEARVRVGLIVINRGHNQGLSHASQLPTTIASGRFLHRLASTTKRKMSPVKTLVILLVFALAVEAKHHKVSATKHLIRTTRFRGGPFVRYRFKTNALVSTAYIYDYRRNTTLGAGRNCCLQFARKYHDTFILRQCGRIA